MKSLWREIIMAVIMGMILPGILLNWAVEEEPDAREPDRTQPPQTQNQSPQPGQTLHMKLRREDGSLETMAMDTYLTGVVLAELPGDFHPEAKKAQSVAARTFACKASRTGGKHGDGSVCSKASCCQAYISVEEYLAKGGTQALVDAAAEAVAATSGYVLTYQGTLIDAVYFSCSGGTTEDAVAVWGTDFPYLRSTDSPGEAHAVHDTDTVYLSKSQVEQNLGIILTGKPETWIGQITYTEGGGVDTIALGGEVFPGTKVRQALGLRSTAFAMKPDAGGIEITTRGFGHRVGMSQYGADAMALGGSTWQEILAHYYRGTSLELTNDNG